MAPPHIIIDIQGDSLVVYVASIDDVEADHIVDLLAGPILGRKLPRLDELRGSLIQRAPYAKLYRFTLVDADRRLFCVERWCFLGAIDDWIPLAGPRPLEEHIKKYAKHLGKESFFELF